MWKDVRDAAECLGQLSDQLSMINDSLISL
jgi:hypothetical protein